MLNDPERLGYVRHSLSGGWKGAIANLVIGTCPIWFGCSMLAHPFWHAVGVVVWFYLSFAIASEIGLSGTDLGSCFAGAVLIVAALFAVNLVPSAGRLVSVAVYLALLTLFTVHALMLFAALVNAVLLLLMKIAR